MPNAPGGQQSEGGHLRPSSFKDALRGSVVDPALLLRVLERTLSEKATPDATEAADIERLKASPASGMASPWPRRRWSSKWSERRWGQRSPD